MANYGTFNESNYETRPYSPVAAGDALITDVMARRAKSLDLQSMLTANQQRQAELDLYRGQMPNKLAQSDLEGATARATSPQVMAEGVMGQARQQKATGDKMMALLESDVASGKAKNLAEAAKAKYEAATSELGMVNQAAQLLDASGPPGSPPSQAVWQQVLKQVPEQLRARLPQSYGPQVRQMIQKILTETPAHLGRIKEIAEQNSGNIDVQKLRSATDVQVEGMRGKTQRDVAQISADAPRTEAARKNQVFSAIAEGKETPGMLEEGTRYMAGEINNSPQIKGLAQSLMMDALDGGKNVGKFNQQIQQVSEQLWNQMAPGKLKQQNPYTKKPGQLSTEEQSWVQRAKQANPGMSEQAIIDQGRKLGKIKQGQ